MDNTIIVDETTDPRAKKFPQTFFLMLLFIIDTGTYMIKTAKILINIGNKFNIYIQCIFNTKHLFYEKKLT